jgi:hypothetical protein
MASAKFGSNAKSAKMDKANSPEKAEGSHWIASAIKHPGALHKELHVPAGKKIPKATLKKASHVKGKEGKRARLALTLSKLRKK